MNVKRFGVSSPSPTVMPTTGEEGMTTAEDYTAEEVDAETVQERLQEKEREEVGLFFVGLTYVRKHL